VRAAAFVRANTSLAAVPLVPEITLHLAAEPIALWERTERDAGRAGLPPPFWAFPWAGGQVLARYLLDHPECTAGRTVLDLAAGSGLVAIAAAKTGAACVTASDTDPLAAVATRLNAAVNGVTLTATVGDILDGGIDGADVVLAGDAFYEKPMADRVLPFLERARAAGALVLVGDPGRAYLPRDRFQVVATYDVPVSEALEDATIKRTTVWGLAHARLPPPPGRG
jgi:predicted nicotinamide N-methyase